MNLFDNHFETIDMPFDNVEWCKECRHFEFKRPHPLIVSTCCVLVALRKSDGAACVVCSERADNYGRSITLGVADIRDAVIRALDLQGPLLWFEHYPHGTDTWIDNYTVNQVFFCPQGRPGHDARISWQRVATICGLAPELLAWGYHDELD
ncbi:hypothetical protein [Pseudomonas sp. TE3610]